MPAALALLHELLKDKNLNDTTKFKTALDFDKVLGLNLGQESQQDIPAEVMTLVDERNVARTEKNWSRADELRLEIEQMGYKVKDSDEKTLVTKI